MIGRDEFLQPLDREQLFAEEVYARHRIGLCRDSGSLRGEGYFSSLLGLDRESVMGMAPKHDQLAAMSDEEPIACYNVHAEQTAVGTAFYRDELARRQMAREGARMPNLANTVAKLT
ncbi:hypothetical protein LA21_10220 [Xanthomonas oryzae pv. oryzae]|nr:hypothetical protein LA21_10220 [Xanthomonas oryzae pv. oryzae]